MAIQDGTAKFEVRNALSKAGDFIDSWKIMNRYSMSRNFYPDEDNQAMSQRGYWGTYISNRGDNSDILPSGNRMSQYFYIFSIPFTNFNGDIFQIAFDWASASLWIRRGNGPTSKIKDVQFERIAKISDIQALQNKIALLEDRVANLERNV